MRYFNYIGNLLHWSLFFLKNTTMPTKKNSGSEGIDDTKTKEKGESQQSKQKGAPSVNRKESKHTKDDSDGAEKNTTKKQKNSI
jgi:hypothetical protein